MPRRRANDESLMTKEVRISGTGSRIGSRRRKEADSPPETIRSEAMDVVSTVAGYDRWSEIYDAEENPLILLEEKHMPALVGEVAGLDVVDVGCGTGRHALRLAAARAHVTAIDFSQEMLNRARAKPGSDSVRFIQHDIAGDLPLKSGSFDRVFCCLVLDHIAALKKFFAELARVRRSNGLIIISVMHPAMMLRGVQARFTDPASGR